MDGQISLIELNCCGADHPNDWHEIPWMNIDFLNEDEDLVMKLSGTDGKVLLPASPYSCCSPHVLTACFHDPLQQRYGADTAAARSLQRRGCVRAAEAPLVRVSLAVHALLGLAVLLQVVIVLLTLLIRSTQQQSEQESSASVQHREQRTRSFPYLS